MKRISSVAVGALLLGALTFVVAPAAHAATTCDESHPIDSTTVHDSVVVPAGAYCEIGYSTVYGNVTVMRGATLSVFNSTINGSVTATQPNAVYFDCQSDPCGNAVTGGISVTGATSFSRICNTRIGGDLVVRNSESGWDIGSPGLLLACSFPGPNDIRGRVSLLNNAGYVEFDNNTVQGNVLASDNTGGGEVINDKIRGSLSLLRNCPAWTYTTGEATGGTVDRQC